METLFNKIADPTYIVLLAIIVLQQREIMGFAKITKEVTAAITELSTLVKVMLAKGGQ